MADGKDPACLFYWENWSGGTTTLSRHLKGCYMDVLNAQFNEGPLSLDQIKTVLGSDFGQAWPTIQKKFKTTADGLFFNSRLEKEKENRRKWVESRTNNLKGHKAPHMGIGVGTGVGDGIKVGGAGGRIPAHAANDAELIQWEEWGNLIVDNLDQHWQGMKGRKVSRQEMDAFISVASRNGWEMDSQQRFRYALRGFDVKSGTTASPGVKHKPKDMKA